MKTLFLLGWDRRAELTLVDVGFHALESRDEHVATAQQPGLCEVLGDYVAILRSLVHHQLHELWVDFALFPVCAIAVSFVLMKLRSCIV